MTQAFRFSHAGSGYGGLRGAAVLTLAVLCACGGGGGGTPATAPSIATQPAGQTVTAGQTATFSVGAAGTAPLAYQWGQNGTALGGATAATYTTPATTLAMNGATFEVTVTNAGGAVTSAPAVLTVTAPPGAAISLQPLAQAVAVGQTATFAAAATGTPSPVCQWQRQDPGGAWTDVPGATWGIYSFTATLADAGAQFRLTATNAIGSATSNSATLTVGAVKPAVLVPPGNLAVLAGEVPAFTVTATGQPLPTCQWQRSGDGGATWAAVTTGSGGTTFTYAAPAAAVTDDGARFRAVLTSPAGTATSSAGILTVASAPLYLPVYASGLQGHWNAYNWDNASAPIALSFTAPAPGSYGGEAIHVQFGALNGWDAFGLGSWTDWNHIWPLYLNEFRTLEFDVYFVPGCTGVENLSFILGDAGFALEPMLVACIPGWAGMTPSQQYGHWFHVTLDVPALKPTVADFFDFLFFNGGSGPSSEPECYLAGVKLGYVERTTPPVPTLTSLTFNAGYDQATLVIGTDEATVFQVKYGIGNLGTTFQPANQDWATTHTAVLTGLTPGASYQYQAIVSDHRQDAGATPNQATLEGTFTLPAVPTAPPVFIFGPLASGASANRANLAWATDRPCTAQITYVGTGGSAFVRNLATLAQTQAFVLDLLQAGGTYAISVKATDTFGLSVTGATQVTTNALAAPTVTIAANPDTAAWTAISPYIYGINFATQITPAPRNLTLDRMGGNRWTAYNWETNASNAGSDYYFESDAYLSSSSVPGEAVRATLAADRALGMATLMTVQLQGYVAADEAGPVAQPFPDLARFLPVSYRKGAPFADPPDITDQSVFMDEFLAGLKGKFTGVDIFTDVVPTFVSLDNEPELWGSTHAEVQNGLVDPEAYLQKTIALARALKDMEPGVVLFGPVHYGFNGIVNWQNAAGFTDTFWFTDQYLQELKAASATYQKRLLDVYDFHWYTEATAGDGTRVTNLQGPSLTADQIQAIVQSPRSLWDPTYTESSWIAQYLGAPVNLLGRLQTRIDADWPGTRLSISEYDNGGDQHIAGAIAQADNLGAFGRRGLYAATLWPMSASPAYLYAAFKMFRDFDGALGQFGDKAIPAVSTNDALVTAYVSQDSTHPGRYVIVALNRSPDYQDVAFTGLPAAAGTAKVYRLDGNPANAANPAPVLAGQVPAALSSWVVTLPPLCVTTLEISPGGG